MIDGAHIGSADEQDDDRSSGLSPPPSTLSITGNTAGVDEPQPSLRDKDELDGWGGPEPSLKEEQSSEASPRSDVLETPLPEGTERWLPDDSDTDGEGRTGFLSTHTEVHAFVVGVLSGIAAGSTGEVQLASSGIAILTGGDRIRLARKIPEKYREQALEEFPTFLAGVGIGYVVARLNAIGALGVGV